MKSFKKLFFAILIILIILLCILGAMVLNVLLIHPPKGQEAELKANIHTIQIRLERYAKNHNGLYPKDVSEILNSDDLQPSDIIMHEFPNNPMLKNNPPMKQISFGQKPSEGNFTYLPVTINGEISGFYLLGYGFENARKRNANSTVWEDIDGDGKLDNVIIIMQGAKDDKTEGLMPPLRDLLIGN